MPHASYLRIGNYYIVLVQESEGNGYLEELRVHKRILLKWVYEVNYIHVVQNRNM